MTFSRRLALWYGMLASIMLLCRQTTADATQDKKVSFRWMVPEAHKKTVENELIYEGSIEQSKEVKGIAVVFVGLVLIPYLVQAVIKLQRQIQHGGIVIDIRKDSLDIRVDKRLPNGLIVVVQPDGKVQFERDEVDGPDNIIASIMKGVGGK